MASKKNNALAWGIGIATVAIAGLGIWYYETASGSGGSNSGGGGGGGSANAGISARQFLATNDTSPSGAKASVDKALLLAALNHAQEGQAWAANAVANGANDVEKQALQMAGFQV